ncbi:hypothetical protein AMECASPLE_021531 [Ameca splendens]|uniref:Secreted protein n=1 Tax=Ameca splendens TaxID=208324 RepID=A0ABV1AAT8_9TELE
MKSRLVLLTGCLIGADHSRTADQPKNSSVLSDPVGCGDICLLICSAGIICPRQRGAFNPEPSGPGSRVSAEHASDGCWVSITNIKCVQRGNSSTTGTEKLTNPSKTDPTSSLSRSVPSTNPGANFSSPPPLIKHFWQELNPPCMK